MVAAACLRLGWWQWEHARQGNTLSYGYALQWPLFAAFGVFFWVRVVRERLSRAAGTPGAPPPATTASLGHSWSFQRGGATTGPAGLVPTVVASDPDDDPDAAAYMHRLRWLSADPRRRLSDYPGFGGR